MNFQKLKSDLNGEEFWCKVRAFADASGVHQRAPANQDVCLYLAKLLKDAVLDATRTAPALATHDEAERQAFEAWYGGATNPDNTQAMMVECFMWDAWQARAALDKAGEVVPSIGHWHDGSPPVDWTPEDEAKLDHVLARYPAAPQPSADDARDAARYRWLLDNYGFGDGFHKIDVALNSGDADTQLGQLIDQAIAALQRKEG